MSTPIESFLYAGRGVHAVVQFTQDQQSIRLRIAPWDELEASKEVVFDSARVTSIDVYADDTESLNLPWDIIGIDCQELDQERWLFVLHCEGIEYGFESRWPTLIGR